jgi:3-dehydroquinate dehydratase II
LNINRIHIINGPNLDLLGIRETSVYGTVSFEEYFAELGRRYESIHLSWGQTNHEGKIIDWLHDWGFDSNTGIVLNAGGYTHSSISIRDAIAAIRVPVAEVHISEISAREDFRQKNFIKDVCAVSIEGRGLRGYSDAIGQLLKMTD